MSGYNFEPIPNLPLVPGHVKVSNPTPETRSPCWMWSGEGRGEIEGQDQIECENPSVSNKDFDVNGICENIGKVT